MKLERLVHMYSNLLVNRKKIDFFINLNHLEDEFGNVIKLELSRKVRVNLTSELIYRFTYKNKYFRVRWNKNRLKVTVHGCI